MLGLEPLPSHIDFRHSIRYTMKTCINVVYLHIFRPIIHYRVLDINLLMYIHPLRKKKEKGMFRFASLLCLILIYFLYIPYERKILLDLFDNNHTVFSQLGYE